MSETKTNNDYHVADISLAEWGHKEIAIAEKEMPGFCVSQAGALLDQPEEVHRLPGLCPCLPGPLYRRREEEGSRDRPGPLYTLRILFRCLQV